MLRRIIRVDLTADGGKTWTQVTNEILNLQRH